MSEIKNMILGNKNIVRAYRGSTLIFEKQNPDEGIYISYSMDNVPDGSYGGISINHNLNNFKYFDIKLKVPSPYIVPGDHSHSSWLLGGTGWDNHGDAVRVMTISKGWRDYHWPRTLEDDELIYMSMSWAYDDGNVTPVIFKMDEITTIRSTVIGLQWNLNSPSFGLFSPTVPNGTALNSTGNLDYAHNTAYSGNRYPGVKIYEFIGYDNNEDETLHLIPDEQNGNKGMYDTINEVFYPCSNNDYFEIGVG